MQWDRRAAVALSDCKCNKHVVSQGIMDSCDELDQELWRDSQSCADAFVAPHLLPWVTTYAHPKVVKNNRTTEKIKASINIPYVL